MKSSVVIKWLRDDFEEIAKDGVKAIDVKRLLEHLQKMEGDIEDVDDRSSAEASWERHRLQIEVDKSLEFQRTQNGWDTEMFRAAVASGEGAVKALLLVTGGTAAAMLAFLGHLVTSGSAYILLVGPVARGLTFIVSALLGTSLIAGLRFVGQELFKHEAFLRDDPAASKYRNAANWLVRFVILLYCACIVLLAVGVYKACAPFL